MEISDLRKRESINGYTFQFNEGCNFYECRGDVMYDDEHDEMPEPGLWAAAQILSEKLNGLGFSTTPEHSEKGWVEVTID